MPPDTLSSPAIAAPYLLFIGEVADAGLAKTALGLCQWCPDKVLGQLRFAGNSLDLGMPDLNVESAVAAGAKSLVIGVAPVGGAIDQRWLAVLSAAARAGLNIVSGLHQKLTALPELVTAAAAGGAELIDVRVPPAKVPIASGRKRAGKRVLMVGTDCAVGKKYAALAIQRALVKAGVDSTFRATGQTGIMIAGVGLPIDAVVADFVSGAAEALSPDNATGHWDVIEGQGSLFHPAYAGVSLGLLHGSQPDAVVLCHDPKRTHLLGFPDYPLPSVTDCIDQNLRLGTLTNPAIRCVGVCVNTAKMEPAARDRALSALHEETGLPCADPLRDPLDEILERLLQ